jgi:shikimate dehydrogenase
MTRPYAEVIGDPIAHSKSPTIHNFWLGKLGIDAEYRACHVQSDELEDYFTRRRGDAEWRGCNVTIPHKQAVVPLLDQCESKTTAIGAVNTIVRQAGGPLVGTNTDLDGVADAVGEMALAGRNAVVIGAGGAARAAFAFLAGQGCASVRVLARRLGKALQASAECGLAADVRRLQAGSGAFAGAALVINATQLGMHGQDAMPGFVLEELAGTAPGALVFDMVYAPLETELLRAARATGLRTADGLLMLVGQAAVAFERFFGRPPPREHDAELRALLTS